MTNWNKQKFEERFATCHPDPRKLYLFTEIEDRPLPLELPEGMWEAIEKMIKEAFFAGAEQGSVIGLQGVSRGCKDEEFINWIEKQILIAREEYIKKLNKEEKSNK